MKTVSVVIPVYQSAAVLDACMESVCGQTHPALQIILADDGSTDGSAALCGKWAARDGRVQVIRREHAGVSAARNAGLAAARGDFLLFADSDDTMHPELAARMLAEQERTGAELVVCGIRYLRGGKARSVSFGRMLLSGREELRAGYGELSLRYAFHPVWNKLYPRGAAGCRFDETLSLGEDLRFNEDILRRCTKIAFLPEALYEYHQDSENSLTRRYSDSDFENALRVYRFSADFSGEMFGPGFRPAAESTAFCGDAVRCVRRMVLRGGKTAGEENRLAREWLCGPETQRAARLMYRGSPRSLAVFLTVRLHPARLLTAALRLRRRFR